MKVIVKNLSEIRPAAKNIRRHTEKQITEYVRSLEMFGQVKPIIVDENGEIICGNGLYEALKRMGRAKCDCYVMTGLSEKQKKKLMLADNRVYELGITDMDAFDDIIRELNGDIDVPGWDEDLLATMNATIDDVNEAVSSYGAYDQADVETVTDHRPAVEGSTAPPAPAPLPNGSENGESAAETQRFVICPKCGERICL